MVYPQKNPAAKVTGLVEKWVAAVRLAQALDRLKDGPTFNDRKSILIMGI